MRALSLVLFFFGLAFTVDAGAIGPTWPITDMPRFWILGEGNSHFSFDGTYFYTKENYDEQGQPVSPSTMEHVRYGAARFHVGHGFTPRMSFFAQADIRGVFSLNSLNSNVSDDENYGLGDAFLAGRWLVYRSEGTDKAYPTEWSPGTLLFLTEGSWLVPMYDRADRGKPPLGDQSNDFTAMGRMIWYVNDWLGVAGNAGYIYRTQGYSAMIPWGLRVDLNFLANQRFRFWLDFQAQERTISEGSALNPTEPDQIPGGSYLFKAESPVLQKATFGTGVRLTKEWELAGAAEVTARGFNSAKGYGGSLGLAWRPYQMPELTYEEYRKKQIQRLQTEPTRYRQREVLRYGFQATVLRVSSKGNFFQIGFGQKDGVKAGDTFQVFGPDDFSGHVRRPLAMARVRVSRTDDSFLRVEQLYDRNLKIKAGYEVRRVILTE